MTKDRATDAIDAFVNAYEPPTVREPRWFTVGAGVRIAVGNEEPTDCKHGETVLGDGLDAEGRKPYASPWVASRRLLHEGSRLERELVDLGPLVQVSEFVWVAVLEAMTQSQRTGYRLLAADDAAKALARARRRDAVAARGMFRRLAEFLDSQDRENESRDLLLAICSGERLEKLVELLRGRMQMNVSPAAQALVLYLERQYTAVQQVHRCVYDLLVPLREGRSRDSAWFLRQADALSDLGGAVFRMTKIATARCLRYLPSELLDAGGRARRIGQRYAAGDEQQRGYDLDALIGLLGRMELALRQALLRPHLERLVLAASVAVRLRATADTQVELLLQMQAEVLAIDADLTADSMSAMRDQRFINPVMHDLRCALARALAVDDLERFKRAMARAAHML
jgi:hypothetical protein